MQQLGAATGLSRRPSLGRRSSGRRRIVECAQYIKIDKEPDTPRVAVTLGERRTASGFFRYSERRARPSARLYLIIVTSMMWSARTMHPMDLDAPLLEPCTYT